MKAMTLTFNISDDIRRILPTVRLGVLSSNVNVSKASIGLNQKIESTTTHIKSVLEGLNESKLEIIDQTRRAYKLTGKEPSRYRPSAEALLRRIRLGKDLYRINNVVDTINLLSIQSQFSIGGFDQSKINGDCILDIGNNARYMAIGRGDLNIEFMPGLRDDLGFFGTPTSDSERTMVTDSLTQLVLVYYDFFANEKLHEAMKNAEDYLTEFCQGTDTSIQIIE